MKIWLYKSCIGICTTFFCFYVFGLSWRIVSKIYINFPILVSCGGLCHKSFLFWPFCLSWRIVPHFLSIWQFSVEDCVTNFSLFLPFRYPLKDCVKKMSVLNFWVCRRGFFSKFLTTWSFWFPGKDCVTECFCFDIFGFPWHFWIPLEGCVTNFYILTISVSRGGLCHKFLCF